MCVAVRCPGFLSPDRESRRGRCASEHLRHNGGFLAGAAIFLSKARISGSNSDLQRVSQTGGGRSQRRESIAGLRGTITDQGRLAPLGGQEGQYEMLLVSIYGNSSCLMPALLRRDPIEILITLIINARLSTCGHRDLTAGLGWRGAREEVNHPYPRCPAFKRFRKRLRPLPHPRAQFSSSENTMCKMWK